jgi:prefoldin subunit 5
MPPTEEHKMFEPNKEDRRSNSWHLSKEVPVALITSLAISVMTGVYAVSKLDSRVEALEKAILKTDAIAATTDNKIESKLNQIQASISELNNKFMQAQIDMAREGTGHKK